MKQYEAIYDEKNEHKTLSVLFYMWSFILLCRPQDYITFLEKMRPSLTLGLMTLAVYFISKKNSENIFSNYQFKLYIYLIVVMIIGVPFSYYRSASLNDVLNYAGITSMFIFLFYQLVNTIEKLRSLLFAYCSGVAVYAIYILKYGEISNGRLFFGNMFDSNDIAYVMISLITFNLLSISNDNKGYVRIISVINIITCLTVVLKTGSRGGLIALIIVFAYLIIAKTKTVNLSLIAKAALVGVAFISLQYISINSDRYKTILDIKDDYNVTEEEGRIEIWKTGVRLMLSHPFTGVGMNRFSEGIGRDREARGLDSTKWQTAHNSFVQIGAETGIIGLILFASLSINAFRMFGGTVKHNNLEYVSKIGEMARIGFLGNFICAMFLSQAYSPYWAFYIVLSVVLYRLAEKEDSLRIVHSVGIAKND